MKSLASPSQVVTALDRGIDGAGISRGEALLLFEHADLRSLLQAAAAVRDASKGRTVSYSKKVFIPLTHLCRDYCGYCTFRADPATDVAQDVKKRCSAWATSRSAFFLKPSSS
jgi:2-iminoacetate synthase ThiH